MKTVLIDGEEYKYSRGRWVDETWIIPPTSILRKIYANIIEHKEKYSYDELVDYTKEMKASELYDEVVVLINYLIEKIDSANDKYLVLRTLIPMQTSCLRLINQPEKAIEFYNELYGIYGSSIGSSALYTSIAAAYCDIDDIDSAVKNANRAHAISKGNSSPELISVYARIKVMKEKF